MRLRRRQPGEGKGRVAFLPRREPDPLRRPPLVVRAWRKARRATDRYRLLTDVVGALALVVLVVALLAAVTGGTWPPAVTIESQSMMHGASETPYGRIGTADVGDIVFVRGIASPSDVELWVDGGPSRYGRPGDVIAFAPDGNRENTTVLHRAITWIDVARLPDGSTEYRMRWIDGKVLKFGAEGIYFPPLGFHEAFGYTPEEGYKPLYSGFVTKGDNAVTNFAADQAMRNGEGPPISRLVEPSWIEGEVYGEIPWMGLGRLALQVGKTNPYVAEWYRVGNAFAPLEAWTCFFATLATIVAVPFALDTVRLYLRTREARRADREARAREKAARRAAKDARRAAAKTPPAPQAPRQG